MKMIQLEVWQGAKILGSRTSCLRILKVSHESQRCFRFVIFKTSPTNMVATNDNNSIKLHITQYHSLWLSAFIILIRVDATMLWSRLLTRVKQKTNKSFAGHVESRRASRHSSSSQPPPPRPSQLPVEKAKKKPRKASFKRESEQSLFILFDLKRTYVGMLRLEIFTMKLHICNSH